MNEPDLWLLTIPEDIQVPGNILLRITEPERACIVLRIGARSDSSIHVEITGAAKAANVALYILLEDEAQCHMTCLQLLDEGAGLVDVLGVV